MAIKQFRLPDLGEGLEDAEVVRWLVAEGDDVALNQPLIEVDTAKALVEIPSPFAGKVQQLHAAEADVVKVGSVLVSFDVDEADDGGSKRTAVLVGYGVEEGAKPKRRRRLSGGASNKETSPPLSTSQVSVSRDVQAPPPVRKLAAELGVDLTSIAGSGPDGRVTREDVLSSVADDPPAAPASGAGGSREEERVAVKGVRRLVAEKMSRSVREIPHVTTYLTFDATEVLRLRDELSSGGDKITPLAVIASAFARTCASHRKLNSSWAAETNEIVLHPAVHLGIATDTERGLIVPVIKDVLDLSVVQIGRQISELSQSARAGKLSVPQLSGSTVTISNVGSFGAEYGTPIINLPEAAILAVGVIEDRVVARSGGMTIRPMCTLSLSFDHRILDGAEAGRALKELKEILEDGGRLRSI